MKRKKKKNLKKTPVAHSRVRGRSTLRLVGGIAPAALAADESASAFYARLEGAGGDFVREERGGGGGGRTSSSSSFSSTSFPAPCSSSSLSLFSRGGDGDSFDEPAVSDSYGSEQTAAALESSRGGGGYGRDAEEEEEEAWGAAVAASDAAAVVACRPAKKKKRFTERGGLDIDF